MELCSIHHYFDQAIWKFLSLSEINLGSTHILSHTLSSFLVSEQSGELLLYF